MEQDREDGDGFDKDRETATNTRRFMRRMIDQCRSPSIRLMANDLRELEQLAEPFFLGLDYDPDLSDVDEGGPF